MPLQNILFKGIPVFYTTKGNGFPLVFLHGFNESINIWDKIIDKISLNHLCILIDLPGFGNSPLPSNLSIKYMAEAVKRIVDQENVISEKIKPIIIGHSMGGYVALEYLKLFEKSVSAIGFIHSTAIADNDEKKENRLKTLEFLENNIVESFFKIFIQGLPAPFNYKKSLIEEIEKIVCKTSKNSVIAGIKAMLNREDNYKIFKNTKLPFLLIAGKYDQLIPLEKLLKQASEAESVMIEVLNNSGHLGMIEEPEKTQDIIIKFTQWVDYLYKN